MFTRLPLPYMVNAKWESKLEKK